ncbi:MAG: flagellar hook-length control protein FliK [Fimbriimonadaceae bacterium]|nr:flagellar hook-length control protein FliK [Alphaproteobacteria bacterium]
MNAAGASLIEALGGTPVKAGGQKATGAVEGLFSALLGETAAVSTTPVPVTLPNAEFTASLNNGTAIDAAAILKTGQASSLEEGAESPDGELTAGIETLIQPTISTIAPAQPDPGQFAPAAPASVAGQVPASAANTPVVMVPPVVMAPIGAALQQAAGTPISPDAAPNGITNGATNAATQPNPQIQAAQASSTAQSLPAAAGAAEVRFAAPKPTQGLKTNAETNSQKSDGPATASVTKGGAKSGAFNAIAASQVFNQSETSTGPKPAAIETVSIEPVSGQAASVENANAASALHNVRSQIPQAASPVAALAVQIATRAMDGARRFEIRMDPPELGRIDVRLKIDDHGIVSTRLMVERPETLELLQRDARALERALSDSGLKTEDGGVRMSLKDGNNNQNAFSGANQDGGKDSATAQTDKSGPDAINNTPPDIAINAETHMIDGMVNILV